MRREVDMALQNLMKNTDIEQGEICCIKATNRQALVNATNAYINSGWINFNPEMPYLRISLSGERLGCSGCSVDYKTEADIPAYSVPCICGNPKHWMIKYEVEE